MIGSQDVTLNVLAPAITSSSLAGGELNYELTRNFSRLRGSLRFQEFHKRPENVPYVAFAYSTPLTLLRDPIAPYARHQCHGFAKRPGVSVSYTYKFDTGATRGSDALLTDRLSPRPRIQTPEGNPGAFCFFSLP